MFSEDFNQIRRSDSGVATHRARRIGSAKGVPYASVPCALRCAVPMPEQQRFRAGLVLCKPLISMGGRRDNLVAGSTQVHVYGNSAVVTGTYRERGTEKGNAYLRRGRFTDTWVYQDNTWHVWRANLL